VRYSPLEPGAVQGTLCVVYCVVSMFSIICSQSVLFVEDLFEELAGRMWNVEAGI